jgi:hypothetical protein
MFLLFLRNLIFLLMLLTAVSCAVDTTSLPDFKTRLSTELAIEGEKCFGGEVVQSEDRVFTCQQGQWLIVVDNINNCTPEGCTEILVPPIIATLRRGVSQGSTTFYDMIPLTPVNDEVSGILAGVSVRFSSNEEPRVQFK